MQVEKTTGNVCKCLCLMCPSYEKICKINNMNENQNISTKNLQAKIHYEKMFCAFEKSNCIHFNKGCLCDKCEVFKKYNLRKKEYCITTGGM